MNELRLEFEVAYSSWLQWWEFKCEAYIDDKPFLPNHYFDIWDIESTYLESCEYELFTCSCGDAGCAGINTTPKIIVSENVIYWRIFEPKKRVFKFDKARYIAEIKRLKERMLSFYTMKQWAKVVYFVTGNVAEIPFLKGALPRH